MARETRIAFVVAALLVSVAAPALCVAGQPPEPQEPDTTAPTPRFVAYYFHGNLRCPTCRRIEAFAEEAITRGFAEELEAGALAWRVVNTDEPDNRHFVQDFELMTKSLVLVEYRDGQVVRSSNLRLVWQLVGDKNGFLKYVRDSTSGFIEQS